ncbi:MAG: NADH-quinone oxidoreductase subunit J [Hyphomicrobiales bacterium]|nr:MAG: NADH-quinone oxidoreductase subunit J [Hyphomicrobiales bacterium]
MSFGPNGIALAIAIPLLAAFLLPIVARLGEAAGRIWGLAATLVALIIALGIYGDASTAPQVTALGGFAPPLGIVLYADTLASIFLVALVIGVLMFWPRGAAAGTRAYTLMLVLLAGGSGLVLSGDLFNIYVFYEIVAVASYGLVASGNSRASIAAAARYVILSAAGSAMALLGIALVYAAAGTLNLADLATLSSERLSGPLGLSAFLLIVIGFGVKAELFPVNSWVPEVYASAPVPVTALLAGVVSKLAMIVILRLLVLVFNTPEALSLLLVLGVLGVIAGELAAYRSGDLKRVFAYSSIAQLGLVAIAFSIPGEAGVVAGLALALHHLVVKPAFFALTVRWAGPIAGLAGAIKASPLAAAIFFLMALSIIGVPPLPGFWAKYLLIGGAIATGSAAYGLAIAVVLIATVIEAAYLFRIALVLYRKPAETVAPRFKFAELAPGLLLGAVVIIAAVAVIPLGDGLMAAANEAADASLYVTRTLGGGQ